MRLHVQTKSLFFIILSTLLFAFPKPTRAQDSAKVDSQEQVVATAPNFGNTTVAVPLDDLDYMETGRHRFSLATPYDAVLTHLYFLEEGNYHPDSAAMALNIQNPGGELAQEKAILLKQFMDGAGYFIDVDAVPHEAEYIDSTTHQHRFTLIPQVPEIFLYRKSRGWVYSWTTVQSIDKLHRRIYPFGTLKWLPKWSQKKVLGQSLWQWLGALLFILFTYLLHKLLTKLIGSVLQSFLQRRVQREHAIEFFQKVARPISLLILFLALNAVYPVLQFPIEVNQWVVTAFQVMIPIYGMLIGIQLVNLVMAYFEVRASSTPSTMDDQLVPMVRNLLKGVVVVFALVWILNRLQVDVTTLLGGVAFGTLAFALAAQDTIKNLFGSVVIFLDRPFQIGDWIIIGEHEGVVEEVSVRSTRIRTFANSLVSIPNGNIASAAINNMGARVYRRFVTRLNLHYTTPPSLIEVYIEGLREIIRNHPGIRKEAFEVHFENMTDNALQVLIYVFFAVPTWTQELEGRQSLLTAALELAQRLGVSFHFPKQTINIGTLPSSVEQVDLSQQPEAARVVMQEYVAQFRARIQMIKPRTEAGIASSEVDSDAGIGRP